MIYGFLDVGLFGFRRARDIDNRAAHSSGLGSGFCLTRLIALRVKRAGWSGCPQNKPAATSQLSLCSQLCL